MGITKLQWRMESECGNDGLEKSLYELGGNELEEKKNRRVRVGLTLGLLNSLLSFFVLSSLFSKRSSLVICEGFELG